MLVDGPNFVRKLYPLKRLTLTKLRLDITRGSRTGTIKKAAKSFDLDKKYQSLSLVKKLARRQTRTSLNDLQRFEVMLLRKRRAVALRKLAKKNFKAAASAKAPVKGKKK